MSHDKGKDYFSVAEFKDVGGDVVRALPPERIHNFSELPQNSRFKSPLDAKIDTIEKYCFEESKPNQHQGRSGKDGNEKILKYRSDGVMPMSSGSSEYMGISHYTTTHLDAGMRKYLDGSQDRRELLRKLEELNNQLSRSGGLERTPKEKSTLGRDFAQNDADGWLSDECSVMSKDSKQTYMNGKKNIGTPVYYANYHEPHIHSSYHHTHIQHDTLKNGSSFESRIPRRPLTLEESSQYLHHQNFPLYLPGQYIDADPDSFKPYQHNDLLHRLSCSCRHCYYKHQNSIQPIPRRNFHNSRFANLRSNPMRYHSNSLVPGDYDFRVARDPSLLYDPTRHMRGNVDFNRRVGGHKSLHPHRNKGERCYPVGGGAPFMTCRNCFELLRLPIKLLKLEGRRQHKLRCGACSTLIYYYFQENKLLISADEEFKNDGDSGELMDGGMSMSVDSTIRTDTKFNSEGLHSSSNDFKLFDEELLLPSTYRSLNTKDTNFIAFAAEEECSQLNLKLPQSKMHCSIDYPENSSSTAPPPSSPLQQHFHPDGKGHQSRQSEHELVIPKVVVPSERKLLREVSMATELEVSCNEYSNSGISQESRDGGKDEVHHLQINRKKSFKDISKHDQVVGEGEITSASVTINGHPLSDRIVKKAARCAGRIQPGNYWYDIRAGFWGVMGGPCLGIIPPFIEEFNYPLPEDCTGGATGVYVNGRELHEKDLELLSLRGLPTTRDRSYIVEISGRVLEEGSGKELDSLGKLARTVEKAKHGFGMKVPKQIVANKIEQQ